MALIVAVLFPLLAALLCWVKPLRSIAWGITVFCLSIVSPRRCYRRASSAHWSSELLAGSKWMAWALVLLLVTFVCTLAAVFAGGYMRYSSQQERLWWFYCNSNLLAFALIVVPAFVDPNMVWVGVELITLFAVLLVAFESTPSALEAAWKFSILTIMGAPISLLGFFVLYWAYHGAAVALQRLGRVSRPWPQPCRQIS